MVSRGRDAALPVSVPTCSVGIRLQTKHKLVCMPTKASASHLPLMPFYVYILYSKPFDKFYIGQTNDFNARLKRHNIGNEKFTSLPLPTAFMFSVPAFIQLLFFKL
jgi:GIY-YIG catalytic domain-containing protein